MEFLTNHPFNKKYVDSLAFSEWNYNWPVVYIIKGEKHIYIWETSNVFKRTQDHLKNEERTTHLNEIFILYDIEYNKSATLDIESQLIQHIAAENSFILQNRNDGLRDHHYYDREKYLAKFEGIWQQLQKENIVHKDLNDIKNSDLFKYSPYKALNVDQYEVVSAIYEKIKLWNTWTYIIKWDPWTWKSVVASYLIKYLKGKEETKNLKIGLVVPMTSLRSTFKKVFKNIDWLNSSMVIGPNDLVENYSDQNQIPYDIIIVDESHRLQKRRNITNYESYDKVNAKLGLSKESTQLDWVLSLSKTQILLYDSNQSIKPSDVNEDDFSKIQNAQKYELKSQMRVKWGSAYLEFISALFDWWYTDFKKINNYDFKLYEDFSEFRNAIFSKDKEFWLSRIVAWYARPRTSKNDPNEHDIEIDWIKMFRNSTNRDWVNSKDALHEVWCIHTVQWYDLNYVWVILWEELSYDKDTWEFIINKNKYHDRNWKRWVYDEYELKRYIINIYKTLLSRWILWTYMYVVDKDLREYLSGKLNND